jgi:hypothetical protein
MRSYNWILSLFLTSLSAFSQDKYIKHTVSKGKLLVRLRLYNIKSSAIYDLNLIPGKV